MPGETIELDQLFAKSWPGSSYVQDGWRQAVPEVCLEGFGRDEDLGGWVTSEVSCWCPPILCDAIVSIIVERLEEGSLERGAVIELTLDKLKSPIRQGLEKGWLAFWKERLQPTDKERRRHRESIEELMLAAGHLAVRLGVEEATRFLDKEPGEPPLELLGAALDHKTQAVGKAAWGLLRKIAKRHPGSSPRIDELALRTAGGPHRGLRQDTARWLARRPIEDTLVQQLREASAFFEPEVREILHAFLDGPDAHADEHADGRAESEDVAEAAWSRERLENWLAQSSPGERAVDRHRRLRLERWLESGEQIEAFEPSPHEVGPPFEPLDSAETVVHLLLKAKSHHYSRLEIEQLFDGVVRFADPPNTASLLRMLSPLLRLEDPFISQSIARWLAIIWLGHDGEPRPQAVSTSARRRLVGLARHPGLLATPSHASGWLDPRVLVDRYVDLPPEALCLAELEAAIARLWTLPEARVEAWQKLVGERPHLERTPEGSLADLPEDELAMATALEPEGPGRSFSAETARRLAKPGHEPGDKEKRDERERLMQAALRTHLGTGDLDNFLENLGFDEAAVERVRSFARRPEISAWSRADEAIDRIDDMPFIAQLSYEAAFERLADAVDYSRRGASTKQHIFTLLEVAQRPHVQVAPTIDRVLCILASRHAANRDTVVDLLITWLEDGRVTGERAAEAIAALAAQTKKGSSYVLESLTELQSAGRWAALIVQEAAERLVAQRIDLLTPRSKGLWLDRLGELMEETGRPLGTSTVERLELMSAQKDAAGKRARRLIKRTHSLHSGALPWQLEIEIELLASAARGDQI